MVTETQKSTSSNAHYPPLSTRLRPEDTATNEDGNTSNQIKVACGAAELNRIGEFREEIFGPVYPELDFSEDCHDPHSIIYYSENSQGIISTARMVFDSLDGLPADDYAKPMIDQLRNAGTKVAEISRFAIHPNARECGMLIPYYKKFYLDAVKYGIDSLVIVVDKKSVGFHKKRIGAIVLIDCIDNIAGSDLQFACMEWKIGETKARFLKWVGLQPDKPRNQDSLEQLFNPYGRHFASILAHPQREMYHGALPYLSGRVVDLGAGPCRLAPLLADKPDVSHYMAVEYAADMIEIARFTLAKLNHPNFSVMHQKIEEVTGQFDSAVSLQSFYAIDDQSGALKRIYDNLVPKGVFVVGTPNPQYDQNGLLDEAEKELMWHPDFAAFKSYNQQLAIHPETTYITMSSLIEMLLRAGFHIESCHTNYYNGGVNFVVARKP